MGNLPTYNELKNKPTSRIFESEEVRGMSSTDINEAEKAYEEILTKIQNNEEIEEGFLGGLIGGAAGALAGPAIGRAICKALGIDQKGTLGKMLTSRLVTTAIGVALGK
jgi:hypothetical protein